jgi:hypothetical protein
MPAEKWGGMLRGRDACRGWAVRKSVTLTFQLLTQALLLKHEK